MFADSGVAGTVGRALLLVGIVGSLFGAIAAISSARTRKATVTKLISRFAMLNAVAAVGAFASMEYAMITRDFSLAYVQKLVAPQHLLCTTSPPCGALSKVRS